MKTIDEERKRERDDHHQPLSQIHLSREEICPNKRSHPCPISAARTVCCKSRWMILTLSHASRVASIQFPPLAHKIAALSLETGRTAREVAKELRETADAVAYRRKITDLQEELQRATRLGTQLELTRFRGHLKFTEEESAMAKSKMANRYTPEFRAADGRAGASRAQAGQLSKEFGCSDLVDPRLGQASRS